MSEEKTEQRTCKFCGKQFVPLINGAGRKYCSIACGNLQNRALETKRKARLREKAKAERLAAPAAVKEKPKRQRVRKETNADRIKELNKQALAAGMSYGKYVLKLQMEKEAAERQTQRKATTKE